MSVEPDSDLRPPGYGHLRAAHADRERAIDVLKAAFAWIRTSTPGELARSTRHVPTPNLPS